jgi:hypothetical protein
LASASSVSTNTRLREKHAASLSRMRGVKLPIRSRCVPSRSHSPRTSGASASVAQLTMSACSTALRRSVAAWASKPSARH